MVYYRLLRFERSTCFYEPSVFSANDQHGSSSPLIILRMELQIFVDLILLGLLMLQLPSRFMGTMLKCFRIAHLRKISSQNLVIVKGSLKLFGREDIFGNLLLQQGVGTVSDSKILKKQILFVSTQKHCLAIILKVRN